MRIIRVALIAGLMAVASMGFGASGVAAYGHAEQPLAQIELSLNCNNPDFPGCQPPPVGFGMGGVWLWIEIDANGTADVAGSVCGHDRHGNGGAASIRGEFEWSFSSTPVGGVLFLDPNGYYVVDFGPVLGSTLSLPVTRGHYSSHPLPGVAIELQVAP
jgi:hypothetical protein